MNTLENWIQTLIEKPIDFKGIADVEEHIRQELETLPLPENNGTAVGASPVYCEILRQLHLKFRGQKYEYEEAIWNNMLWYLSHPLPATLAHDLIDRGVAVIAMSHTRQEDEVQWRLATINEDALYTLIRERYLEPKFSTEQFEMMLQIYCRRHDGLLTMLLSFWTESPAKEAVFIAAIERELEHFSELKKQQYKRSGATYFKQTLAARDDIIEQLNEKYRQFI